MAQIFIGNKTMVRDIYELKSEKQFVNALEDNIRHRESPTKLVSDSSKSQLSDNVNDLLRSFCINQWSSES